MQKSPNYKRYLYVLIIISCALRIVLSAFLELTNDEVNYWTYALYPSLSYFDHPPLVGWLIRLSTFNLSFNSELFVRLFSIIFGAINSIIIFKIGESIKNSLAGFYSALLYNASIYCFLICGTFIMPDTPQVLFWLLSMYFIIKSFSLKEITKTSRYYFLLFGITVGLGLLSKYHSIFLWVGALLFIFLFDRKWIKVKELYLSLLISILLFLPVLIWNYQNDFISFTFQSERIDILKSGLRFDYFFTELGGEIFYNNPIIFILIIITLFKIKNINLNDAKFKNILLLFSLPNILIFLLFSLFRKTLPHWTGPGYLGLIILTASFLSQKENLKKISNIPFSVFGAITFTFVLVFFGYIEINNGIINLTQKTNKPEELGRNDLTLDMYGWKQIEENFKVLNRNYLENKVFNDKSPIISNKWYNAGHIDYYLGQNLNKKVYCAGNLNDIRNYKFVNQIRGDMEQGQDAIYLSPSRDYKNPNNILTNSFFEILPLDTIKIFRNGNNVENVFVYKLSRYNGKKFY